MARHWMALLFPDESSRKELISLFECVFDFVTLAIILNLLIPALLLSVCIIKSLKFYRLAITLSMNRLDFSSQSQPDFSTLLITPASQAQRHKINVQKIQHFLQPFNPIFPQSLSCTLPVLRALCHFSAPEKPAIINFRFSSGNIKLVSAEEQNNSIPTPLYTFQQQRMGGSPTHHP